MAAIAPTITDVGENGDGAALLVVWTPVTESDTCNAVSKPKHADKSVHVSGTFGGTSVGISGSNNGGSSFAALNDPSGDPIAITAEGINAVLENAHMVKPVLTGGSSTSITISMLFKLANGLRQ